MRSILSKLFSKSETIKSTLGSGFLDQETARPLKPWEVDNYIIQTLARIETTLANLAAIVSAAEQADRERDVITMSQLTEALDRLETQTQAIDGAADSAEAAFTRLAELVAGLREGATDPAQIARIDALSTELQNRAAQLGAAVEASPT